MKSTESAWVSTWKPLARALAPYALIFLILQLIIRVSLLARIGIESSLSLSQVGICLLIGMWLDLVTGSLVLLPVLFLQALSRLLPSRSWRLCFDALLRFFFAVVLIFDLIAEHLFWSEFHSRFNFIAVDYLVYTHEVIGNIIESYPMGWLMLALLSAGFIIAAWSLRLFAPEDVRKRSKLKLFGEFALFSLLAGLLCYSSSIEQSHFSEYVELNEAASNGIYDLFHAFTHNELSYDRFYVTQPPQRVEKMLESLLGTPIERSSNRSGPSGELLRSIAFEGPELHKNVIIVVMESMSAEFMGCFSPKRQWTPHLDQLASQGLLLTNAYATGTRTVRGLEAITLSLPPTPGQSILRRPGNEGLFSIGYLFQERGYDTHFIYGGFGYFDNMNAFFGANGFQLFDRAKMDKADIQFANIWGVCDEDLFKQVIKQADASNEAGKPFMQVVMTTTNHRPYTYPEGRIDVKSKSGRSGGVKYADYSVGWLMEQAHSKDWFDDTIFVFVADHTAGASGKSELDPRKYHIPILFYAPNLISPARYDALASQIDVAPTLLGLMKWSYLSKFYGRDILHETTRSPRAFISNYQKVALVQDDVITVLSPVQKVEQSRWPSGLPLEMENEDLVDQAITYYQSASSWREKYRRLPPVPEVSVVVSK